MSGFFNPSAGGGPLSVGTNSTELILNGQATSLIGSYFLVVTNITTGCSNTSDDLEFACGKSSGLPGGPAEIEWDHNGIPGSVDLTGIPGVSGANVVYIPEGFIEVGVCGDIEIIELGDIPVNGCLYSWLIINPIEGNFTSDQLDFTYTAQNPGVYPVFFSNICNLGGGYYHIGSAEDVIVIPYIPDFYYNVYCGETGYDIDFIDASSYLSNFENANTQYEWIINGDTFTTRNVSLTNMDIGDLDVSFTLSHPNAQGLGTIPNNLPDVTYTITSFEELDPFPTADFTVTPQVVCSGNPFFTDPTYTGEIINPLWIFDDGSSLIIEEAEKVYFNISGVDESREIIFSFENAYGCTALAKNEVIVTPNLIGGEIEVTPGSCVLEPAILTFVPDPALPNLFYDWSNQGTDISTEALYSGIYSVDVYDAIGCSYTAPSVYVDLPEELDFEMTINYGNVACTETNIYSYVTNNPNFDYEWTVTGPNPDPSNNNNSSGFSFSALESGIYTLTLEITTDDCGPLVLTGEIEVFEDVVTPTIAVEYLCDDANSAELTVTAPSGFVWDDNGTSTTPRTVLPGNYQAVSSNDHCEARAYANISMSPDLTGFPSGCYHLCVDELAAGVLLPIDFPSFLGQGSWTLEHEDGSVLASGNNFSDVVLTMDDSWPAGNYTLKVNKNGCVYESEILELIILQPVTAVISEVTCATVEDQQAYDFTYVISGLDVDPGSAYHLFSSQGDIEILTSSYDNGTLTITGQIITGAPLTSLLCIEVMPIESSEFCPNEACAEVPECDCDISNISHSNIPNCVMLGEEFCFDITFNYSGPTDQDYEVVMTAGTTNGVVLNSSSPDLIQTGQNTITLCFTNENEYCSSVVNLNYTIYIGNNEECNFMDMLWDVPCCQPDCDFEVIVDCGDPDVTFTLIDASNQVLDPAFYEITWFIGDQAFPPSNNPISVAYPFPNTYSVHVVGLGCDEWLEGTFDCCSAGNITHAGIPTCVSAGEEFCYSITFDYNGPADAAIDFEMDLAQTTPNVDFVSMTPSTVSPGSNTIFLCFQNNNEECTTWVNLNYTLSFEGTSCNLMDMVWDIPCCIPTCDFGAQVKCEGEFSYFIAFDDAGNILSTTDYAITWNINGNTYTGNEIQLSGEPNGSYTVIIEGLGCYEVINGDYTCCDETDVLFADVRCSSNDQGDVVYEFDIHVWDPNGVAIPVNLSSLNGSIDNSSLNYSYGPPNGNVLSIEGVFVPFGNIDSFCIEVQFPDGTLCPKTICTQVPDCKCVISNEEFYYPDCITPGVEFEVSVGFNYTGPLNQPIDIYTDGGFEVVDFNPNNVVLGYNFMTITMIYYGDCPIANLVFDIFIGDQDCKIWGMHDFPCCDDTGCDLGEDLCNLEVTGSVDLEVSASDGDVTINVNGNYLYYEVHLLANCDDCCDKIEADPFSAEMEEISLTFSAEKYYCFKLVIIGYTEDGHCDVVVSDCVSRIIKRIKKNASTFEEFEFSLYPNPLDGSSLNLTIPQKEYLGKQFSYEFIDVSGAIVSRGAFTSQGLNTFDMSMVESGIYILAIKDIETGKSKQLRFTKL